MWYRFPLKTGKILCVSGDGKYEPLEELFCLGHRLTDGGEENTSIDRRGGYCLLKKTRSMFN